MSAIRVPSFLSNDTWLAKGAFLMMMVPGLLSVMSERCHSDGANGLKVLTLCRWYVVLPSCSTSGHNISVVYSRSELADIVSCLSVNPGYLRHNVKVPRIFAKDIQLQGGDLIDGELDCRRLNEIGIRTQRRCTTEPEINTLSHMTQGRRMRSALPAAEESVHGELGIAVRNFDRSLVPSLAIISMIADTPWKSTV